MASLISLKKQFRTGYVILSTKTKETPTENNESTYLRHIKYRVYNWNWHIIAAKLSTVPRVPETFYVK